MKNPALGRYELTQASEFAGQLNVMDNRPESPVTLLITNIDPPVRCTFDYDEDEGFVLTDFETADDVEVEV